MNCHNFPNGERERGGGFLRKEAAHCLVTSVMFCFVCSSFHQENFPSFQLATTPFQSSSVIIMKASLRTETPTKGSRARNISKKIANIHPSASFVILCPEKERGKGNRGMPSANSFPASNINSSQNEKKLVGGAIILKVPPKKVERGR